MRTMRFRRARVPRDREADALTVAKCMQTFTRHSTTSSQSRALVSSYEHLPSASVRPHSSSQTNARNLVDCTPDMIVTPRSQETKEPILLLEGDQYRFSDDGIALSLYELTNESTVTSHDSFASLFCNEFATSSLAIEEVYDLDKARKGFVVRKKVDARKSNDTIRFNPIQDRVLCFDDLDQHLSVVLQEISEETLDPTGMRTKAGPGTGSRTWDSSIAMSMYFASHPELMAGDVIELGSGVGLGGILSFLFRSLSPSCVPFHSLTLTDYKDEVLDYCNENVRKFFESHPSFSSIDVAKLDWYDFLSQKETVGSSEHTERYDTVIACDCAYLYPDIVALVRTMKGLLKRKKTSKVHIFGPSNRGGLHQLISNLREEELFDVREEYIDMARYRLDVPNIDGGSPSRDPLQEIISHSHTDEILECFNRYDSKFLHITCSIRFDDGVKCHETETSAWDID